MRRVIVFLILGVLVLSSCTLSGRNDVARRHASSNEGARVLGGAGDLGAERAQTAQEYFRNLDVEEREQTVWLLAWLGTSGFYLVKEKVGAGWPPDFSTDTATALIVCGGRAVMLRVPTLSEDTHVVDAYWDSQSGQPLSSLQTDMLGFASLLAAAVEGTRDINLGKDIAPRFPVSTVFDWIDKVDNAIGDIAGQAGATDYEWVADAPILSEDMQCFHYYYLAATRNVDDPTALAWEDIVCVHVFSEGFFLQDESEIEFFATTLARWQSSHQLRGGPTDWHDLRELTSSEGQGEEDRK